MKNIYIKDYSAELPLDSNLSVMLVMENKRMFSNTLLDIMDDSLITKHFTIIDNDKEIKLNTCVDVISSVLELDVNIKKNVNTVIRLLKDTSSTYLQETATNINSLLVDVSKKIGLDFPLDLMYNVEFQEEDVLDNLNITIDDSCDNLLENILKYVKVCSTLFDKKIYIVNNLCAFLSREDLVSLLEELKLMCVTLIDIESVSSYDEIWDVIKVIDCDICII